MSNLALQSQPTGLPAFPSTSFFSLFKMPSFILVASAFLLLLIVANYQLEKYRYRKEHSRTTTGQLPPKYPSLVPFIGSIVSLLWNTQSFLHQATSFGGKLSAAKITCLGKDVYLFQERETVKKIWRQQSLSSPISIYLYVLKYFFGLPESALDVYRADDSGPMPKPYPHSRVKPQDRIDHITHHPYLRALSGPGLGPTVKRFQHALERRMGDMRLGDAWIEEDNLECLFQRAPTASLIECIFGPTLLQLNPNFVQEMWKFDNCVPWFARAIPALLMPEPYRLRERLRGQLQRWYQHARKHFKESDICEDGDGDPFWGSELIRHRQKVLRQVQHHDDTVLSSTDIGLVWGAMGNTIPVAMFTAMHIYKDAALLERVRTLIAETLGGRSLLDMDPQELTNIPLLSSIYAEILRVYVNTYFMVSSPHVDVPLGKWRLPKGQIGLLNAHIAQMDNSFWNTQDGLHPVESFWADRFIIDPNNDQSGPIRPELRKMTSSADQGQPGKPYFSKEGTEGSWFPYGGGHSICPGRFLAKRVVLFTCALLVHQYDMEVLGHEVRLDSFRFGLGVGQLQQPIPFRMRKRQAVA